MGEALGLVHAQKVLCHQLTSQTHIMKYLEWVSETVEG